MLPYSMTVFANGIKHLAVSKGLPNNEVRQLIELPKGQIFAYCEGAFALFNESRFTFLIRDRQQTNKTPHHMDGFTRLWQGDTLLQPVSSSGYPHGKLNEIKGDCQWRQVVPHAFAVPQSHTRKKPAPNGAAAHITTCLSHT